ELRKIIHEEKRILEEIKKTKDSERLKNLWRNFSETNGRLLREIIKTNLDSKSLNEKRDFSRDNVVKDIIIDLNKGKEEGDGMELSRGVLKRFKRKERSEEKSKMIKKPSKYVATANKLFGKKSIELIKKDFFQFVKRDLIKANLPYL